MLYADDDSKYSRNRHEYCRRRRYMSMTPANGGTYAGQYPCDGWVDSLEPTLLMTCFGFLIQEHNLKKDMTVIDYLQDKH